MLGSHYVGGFSPGQVAWPWFAGDTGELVTAADTLVTMSDAITSYRARSLMDTATTATDLLSLTRYRSLTDTALTVTDSVRASLNRSVSDVIVAPADSLVANFLLHRAATDTLVTASDSVGRSQARSITDTLATVTDSIATVRTRVLADTLATVTDTLVTRRSRSLVDTAATVTDALDLAGLIQRFLTDTIASVSDTPSVTFPRFLSDTLTTASDAIATRRQMLATDTLVTPNDVLRKTLSRELTDTIITLTELFFTNDMYRNRIQISGASGSVAGATKGATLEPGEYRPDDFSGYKETVWYEWTAPATGKYRFVVTPADLTTSDAWMAIYLHDVVSGANLETWVDFSSYVDLNSDEIAVVNLYAQAGESYDLQIGSFWTTTPRGYAFTLTWQEITLDPVYDDFPGLTVGNGDAVFVNTEWCTREPGDPWTWIRGHVPNWWTPQEYIPSNRTAILKVTPDLPGTVSLQFMDDFYGFAVYVFDGDGVTDISQLLPGRIIASTPNLFGGTLEWEGIAGRDYYVWLAGEDGPFGGADARTTVRVAWATNEVPVNDTIAGAIDLDDELWHNTQNTTNATHESFRDEPHPNSSPLADPVNPTIWFRMTTQRDGDAVDLAWRNATGLTAFLSYFNIEWYTLWLTTESVPAVADTLVTMSDTLTVIPRTSWQLTDTAATMADTLAKTALSIRSMSDRIATISDGLSGPNFDHLVFMSDSLASRRTRRITQSMGTFSGPMVGHNLNRLTRRNPAVTDTITTMSDTVAGQGQLRISDTIATITDTPRKRVATTMEDRLANVTDAVTFPPTDTIVHMTDEIRRSYATSMTDTGAAFAESLVKAHRRFVFASDTIIAHTDGPVQRHIRRRRTDDIITFFGDFWLNSPRKTKPRSTSDTICTISDGVSV